MGLGQGSICAPPSWIQLSSVHVNIFRRLDFGQKMHDLLTRAIIHTIAEMFVEDHDLYYWHEPIVKPDELFAPFLLEVMQLGQLLIATDGNLKGK